MPYTKGKTSGDGQMELTEGVDGSTKMMEEVCIGRQRRRLTGVSEH